MNDPVLKAVVDERKQLERRLQVLQEVERQLRIAGPAPVGTSIGMAHRTPSGELKKAIVAALQGVGPIMSLELKKRLKSRGYDHPINGQYFTKTLRGLVDNRLVKKVTNGAYSTYELKAARA